VVAGWLLVNSLQKCLYYGRVIHRKSTLNIFQLMSFSIVLTDSVFTGSVTVSVIFYFSVTVIVTVNLNNTVVISRPSTVACRSHAASSFVHYSTMTTGCDATRRAVRWCQPGLVKYNSENDVDFWTVIRLAASVVCLSRVNFIRNRGRRSRK